MRLRIGSRKSPLARAQAEAWARSLVAARPDVTVEWVWITTSGDRFVDRPLESVGGKGLFLKEIEAALCAGTIDVAVHSGKDVPVALAPGLIIAATPTRASPWDVLCLPASSSLPPAGAVGTGSGRRVAQLKRRWPTLDVVPLRGNVDTRLNRVRGGALAAVVLAEAGLDRLGIHWEGRRERMEWMIPAPTQGTLAIETRADDADAATAVRVTHDDATHWTFLAERAAMAAVGGDCFLPFGAHAQIEGGRMRLRVGLWARDGSDGAELSGDAPCGDAVALGRALGEQLQRQAGHLK